MSSLPPAANVEEVEVRERVMKRAGDEVKCGAQACQDKARMLLSSQSTKEPTVLQLPLLA